MNWILISPYELKLQLRAFQNLGIELKLARIKESIVEVPVKALVTGKFEVVVVLL